MTAENETIPLAALPDSGERAGLDVERRSADAAIGALNAVADELQRHVENGVSVERLRLAIGLHRNHYFRGPGTLIWHTCGEECAPLLAEAYNDPRVIAESIALEQPALPSEMTDGS